MMNAIPDAIRRSYQILRPVVYGSANKGERGLQVIATVTAVMIPKAMIIQDNVGGPVMTADVEIYMMPGTNVRVDDQLLDCDEGSRWRVVKYFPYPTKTKVWAARSE
jgi:hypothetical protein